MLAQFISIQIAPIDHYLYSTPKSHQFPPPRRQIPSRVPQRPGQMPLCARPHRRPFRAQRAAVLAHQQHEPQLAQQLPADQFARFEQRPRAPAIDAHIIRGDNGPGRSVDDGSCNRAGQHTRCAGRARRERAWPTNEADAPASASPQPKAASFYDAHTAKSVASAFVASAAAASGTTAVNRVQSLCKMTR